MSDHAASTVLHLPAVAGELLQEARGSTAGRAARTLVPGPALPLKQTLLALVEGASLADHEAPPAATLFVLQGRVRLTAGHEVFDLDAGDHVPIPPVRHGLDAVDDSVVLLSVGTD